MATAKLPREEERNRLGALVKKGAERERLQRLIASAGGEEDEDALDKLVAADADVALRGAIILLQEEKEEARTALMMFADARLAWRRRDEASKRSPTMDSSRKMTNELFSQPRPHSIDSPRLDY